jgi:hypothetical protein
VAVLAVGSIGGPDGAPAPAFAASLIRFANASPEVLLQLPGWHVTYVEQEPDGFGEMHFVRGASNAQGNPVGTSGSDEAAMSGRVASVTWAPETPDTQQETRGRMDASTGLGVIAKQFVTEGQSRDWLDLSAFFIYRHRVFRFRATVPNTDAFRTELKALHTVDATTWLEAMPPSVIKSANTGVAVEQILKGIPLPPGFGATKIAGGRLTQNRYDLAANVTGTVACMWIADWAHARATGNKAAVTNAINAMATAPRWPVFRWMRREGAWPQVLTGYAKALPRGTWYGRPLTGEVSSGLGCSQLGIQLGPATRLKPVPGTP